jgi:hypothetical protein
MEFLLVELVRCGGNTNKGQGNLLKVMSAASEHSHLEKLNALKADL